MAQLKPMAVLLKEIVNVRINVMASSTEDAVAKANEQFDAWRHFKRDYQPYDGKSEMREGLVYQEYAEERAYLAVDHTLDGNFQIPDDGGDGDLRFYEPDDLPKPMVEMHLKSPGMGMTPVFQFLETVARMTKDGEALDGEEFDLTCDDAVDTLHRIIDEAREFTGIRPSTQTVEG